MSANGQRIMLGPLTNAGEVIGGAKLYHFNAGLSTLKDIYEDRAKSITLAQPFVADAEGIWNFFGDGLYKLIFALPSSTGPTDGVLYTLDNFQIRDFADPSLSEGASVTAASTVSVGPEIWLHIGGSTTITQFIGTVPFFWAVFDGSLTLTHSVNLILPGAVNLTVQPGDVLFFLLEDVNTYRLAGQMPNSLLINATDVIVKATDTRTNTADLPLTVRSETTNTPAAGIGVGILFQAESADEVPSNAGALQFGYNDVTAGSEDTALDVLLRVAGAALTKAYSFVTTTAFRAIFSHANSADRTYTLPNSSDTLVGRNTTDTLTNKTIGAGWNVTEAAPSTPAANGIYTESFIRGYVIFDVAGNIDSDLNVSSVTDNGAGDWTINWARAFNSANYMISLAMQSDQSASGGPDFFIDPNNNPTASACRVTSWVSIAATPTLTDPTGTRARLYVSAVGVQ